MSEGDKKSKHKGQARLVKRALLWGVVSVTIYVLVFLNQDTVTRYFTEGGIFALVVVVTALAFSLIHGSFASYILELLGIQPAQGGKH